MITITTVKRRYTRMYKLINVYFVENKNSTQF